MEIELPDEPVFSGRKPLQKILMIVASRSAAGNWDWRTSQQISQEINPANRTESGRGKKMRQPKLPHNVRKRRLRT